MTLSPVVDLVRSRIGLDATSLGAAFGRVVERRMRARGVTSETAYATLLAADPAEWAVFAEDMVVPESWFFRGGPTYFQQLARWVRGRAAARTVRVLSVPSGGGEEPYSLAIALDEEGVPPGLVRIDAVDLSPAQVARAEAGRYPAFSFRESGIDPRPRYFRDTGAGRWELDQRVREAVHFRTGNLVAAGALAAEPPYDLILCRNLFIYLTDDARARAVATLHRLLTPGGRLYLTPAEADRLPPDLFTPDGPATHAVFRRSDDPPANGPVTRSAKSVARPSDSRAPVGSRGASAGQPASRRSHPRLRPVARPAEPAARPAGATAPPDRPHPVPPPPDAVRARALADAGKLDDARAVCERAVASAPTAEVYSLLGVVHLAAGRHGEAEDAFRRALYLKPDHREALTHMAMLCDRRGEPGEAAGLRRRLARLPEATA